MKKLEFSKEINAPVQRVWDALWNDENYSQWTAVFNPNGESKMQTDWKVGGRTLFVDTKGNGMISTIKNMNEPHEIVYEHLGEIIDGVEDTKSEKVQSYAGALEEYHLSEIKGITTLKVSVQINEEWEKMMINGFTEGMEIVKRLAES